MGKQQMTVRASLDELEQILSTFEEMLMNAGCPGKTCRKIMISIEEIFVNVANYAYAEQQKQTGEEGLCWLEYDVDENEQKISLTIADQGYPFDPLAKEDPDLTLSVEDRPIGGLGIYMTKQFMDDVHYERKEDKNILYMEKCWKTD